jgi:hypothetical protein
MIIIIISLLNYDLISLLSQNALINDMFQNSELQKIIILVIINHP